MSQTPRPAPRVQRLRIDRRRLRPLVAAVVALVVLTALSVAASAYAPRAVATAAELDAQRAAAELAVQRIYVAGIEQLKTTRSLRLAITDAQAAVIQQKYTDQLKQLRRTALAAVGEAYGQTTDQSAQYATQAEQRLDAAPAPSAPPVLLAPRLYAIVDRMGQLTGALSDQGTREMTQTASSPAPSASPSGSPRPSASASPTR